MGHLKDLANLEELDHYERSVQDYLNLQIDADRFTAIRLQLGVYGQRQEGVHMVRVKTPGGRLSADRLITIAEVLEEYSEHDVVHITTRQDIQLHYVPLQHTAATLKHLAKAGITTREACGNTLRNMTTCPLAGVCPREHVDITTHLNATVSHFLRNPLNQQMPRKFKVSFSACESDCAQGMMHDLGVIAVRDGTRFGFKVVAGGGLGHKPREALVVEQFVEEKDLLLVIEAVVSLHNRYSDRTKRAKSRIKFLVDKFGREGFIEKYREELAKTKTALATQEYPKGEWIGGVDTEIPGSGAPRKLFAQKQNGLWVFPIAVPSGDLNAAQLRGIAAILEKHELTDIRTTQDQNLMIMSVPKEKISALRVELGELGLGEPQAGDNVVNCPGTSTCRLGITSSPVVAPKLSGGKHDLRIRVSGCHNGCAQPETGDIGIYGEGKRMHGKLIPHYQMYFGGDGMAGGNLALKGPSVPSARIERAIKRVQEAYDVNRNAEESFFNWVRRVGQPYFQTLLADLVEVRPEEVASVLRDHGQEADFRVLQLGGGECAGSVQLQIGSNFFEAAHERLYRDALVFQRKFDEAAKCGEIIARLVSQGFISLLGGKKYDDLVELAEEMRRVAPNEAHLADQLVDFNQGLSKPAEELNDKTLNPLFKALDAWTREIAELSTRHDRQLDLSEALPKSAPGSQPLHFQRLKAGETVITT